MTERLDLTQFSNLSPAERSARAYAFLRASMKSGAGTYKNINDVADCIIPFVNESLRLQAGEQLDFTQLQNDLKDLFSFEIPVLTLQYILPRLQSFGSVEYNASAKIYLVTAAAKIPTAPKVSVPSLREDFQYIVEGIRAHALRLGEGSALVDVDWAAELISFLREPDIAPQEGTITFRGALIANRAPLARYIVADYLTILRNRNDVAFSNVINIYIGILIEQFIRDIQSFGGRENLDGVNVYYDTPLLMRILGTSVSVTTGSARELHGVLRTLGATTMYFEHTYGEVSNILDTIVGRYSAHREITGETGDALLAGDVTIEDLRVLNLSADTKLAARGIYQSEAEYIDTKFGNKGQIAELKFQESLYQAARRQDSVYSVDNAKNDTKALALIMRLRGRTSYKDLRQAGHVFVTSNALLVREARKFIAESEGFGWSYVPPFFTDRQMSAFAWLMSARDISEEKATGELIANCYDAMKPSAEWVAEYIKGFREYRDNEEIGEEDFLLIATARKIALDRSLGNTAALGRLSTQEILEEARRTTEAERVAQAAETEVRLAEARKAAKDEANVESRAVRAQKIEKMSGVFTALILMALRGVILFGTLFFVLYSVFDFKWSTLVAAIVGTVFTLIALLPVLGIADPGKLNAWAQSRLRASIAHRLDALLP